MKRLAALILLLCSGAPAQGNPQGLPDDYAERLAQLERRYAATPGDAGVLEALAGSYAMGGRYSEAIRVLRELIALRPADVDQHLRLANLYSWSGDTESAIQELRSLGDRGGAPALELECQLLASRRDAVGATACYARLKQAAAGVSAQQAKAQLGLARNLAWSGKAAQAIRAYREYHRLAPQDTAAAIEFTELLCNLGHFSEAERVISSVLLSQPDNARALSIKATVLHWAGHRAHEASGLAAEAIALSPDLPEARIAAAYALNDLGDRRGATTMFRELHDRVQSAGPDKQASYWGGYEYLREHVPGWEQAQVLLPFSEYNDTDGIHDTSRSAHVRIPLGNNTFAVTGQEYRSSAPVNSIFSSGRTAETARVLSAATAVHLGPDIQLETSGGVASFGRGFSKGIFSVGFNGSPVDRWVFNVRAYRDILAVTPRSMAVGLALTGFEAGAEYYFNSRTSLRLRSGRNFWNDGNKSVTGDLRVQRVLRYSKRFAIDAGPRARTEAFARYMMPESGIFTPELYQCYEAFIGAHGELGNRLIYDIRSAVGAQRINGWSDFQTSAEVAAALTINFSHSLGLSANYTRRNYNIVSGFGSYQGIYIQLGIQR